MDIKDEKKHRDYLDHITDEMSKNTKRRSADEWRLAVHQNSVKNHLL